MRLGRGEETICDYPKDTWLGWNTEQRGAAAEVYVMAYSILAFIIQLAQYQYTEARTVCDYPVETWNLFSPSQREGAASMYAIAYGNKKLIKELSQS